MANEAPRLSTADLRRRLLAPGSPAPIVPSTSDTAPRPNGSQRPDYAELPLAEEAIEGAETGLPAEQAQLPPNRMVLPELVRPSGRSSQLLLRPVVSGGSAEQAPQRNAYARPEHSGGRYAEQNPLYDSVVEQFRMDAEQLRRENQQFQQLMEEMRQLLQEASEQEQRIQAELVERDAHLAESRAKVTELETVINTKPKTKSELEEWADELERESFQIAQQRRVMDEDRKQLRDDEAALETQMREMEVQMARERAMLARQEQELKRLNDEIHHELELMQRGDGSLRERLAVFQRRHAEVVGGPAGNGVAYATYAHAAPAVQSATPTPPPKKNDTTGLLRKIFRGGD